ncbi:hypothetical protein BDZ97DRAFT_2074722 [Flammula alnicola]|nr:hypothetical protein BDZ97DRAFT_2074722 [Flammula alnicola]
MERRTTRTKKSGVNPLGETAELSENEVHDSTPKDEPEFTEKKPRPKKRKTGENKDNKEGAPPQWKRVRGKRGMLKQLVEMPLDLLFEIFGRVDPVDLLHMARTTKALRAILMSRSSISVWKQSRSNIERMPNCPDDLTEPQYANLAFGRSCSFCQRNLSVIHIAWSARVRCCKKCLDVHFMQVKNHTTWLTAADRGYPSLLAHWAPCLIITRTTVSRKSGPRTHDTVYVLQSTDQLWKDEYASIQDPNAKHEWINRKLEERYAIEKHARECESWCRKVQGENGTRTELLIAERKAILMENVKELGWEEELYKLSPVDYYPQYEPRVERFCETDITESVLSDFRNFLNLFMKRTKSQRLFQEHSQYLESRRNILHEICKNGSAHLPLNSLYPTVGELYRITEDNPSLVDYSKSYPDALLVPFPDIALLWRKDIERKLLDLITNACGADHVFDPSTVFDLATTFFKCTSCYPVMLMRDERAMKHRCATVDGRYRPDEDPYKRAFRVVLGVSWNACGCIKFDPEDLKTLTEVVEMCGFDPKVTTAHEMDEADPIIECLSCNHIDEGRATMTWAAVRGHQRASHDQNGKAMVLKLLDEEEAIKVRERMKEEQARQLHKDYSYKFMCPHCKSAVGALSTLRKHLKQNHGMTKVKDDELVYALDQNRIPSLYRLWPPRDEEPEGDLHQEPQLGDLHEDSDESGL